MKNKIVFLSLVCLSLGASEREFKALLHRQNQQTLIFIALMSSLGASKLLENMNQMCSSEDKKCLQIVAPVVFSAVLGGAYCYKKLFPSKGAV
jgi:hypothetical protein